MEGKKKEWTRKKLQTINETKADAYVSNTATASKRSNTASYEQVKLLFVQEPNFCPTLANMIATQAYHQLNFKIGKKGPE